ncbi:hypothetical protein DFQ01_12812 [Paenibacillus cellulosilyticus]|uniref:YqfQ-like protein n=1 Tax=Paenibacillus cellulosilyticus TaxID=375489 RepID=A0A2V2YLW5_9BACL|nr:hypothetical protein [Paenibacillus cellulosilyticus]PWV95300.1 hypothetical protein DFQ01_12812 [Paenibacillus cellulosilyticus]QKS44082.1 hypothetical protein HUB94_06300 [Paenibacillus cellulosilyticus]
MPYTVVSISLSTKVVIDVNVRNGPPQGYPPHPYYDPYARQNSPFPGISDPVPGPFGFGGGLQSGGVPGGPAPSHKTTGAIAAENLLEGAAKSSLPVLSNAAELAEIVEPGGGKAEKKEKGKGILGGFSLDKIGELKGVVDRLGGIDGILNSVGKMQKVVANFQQMAPLIKVLAGSFKKESKSSQKLYGDDDDIVVRPKRRKRRKPGGGGKGRKPGAQGAATKGSGPRPRPNAKKTR